MLYHALLSAVEVRVLIGHCDGLASPRSLGLATEETL
jgi:hypothetical protein